MSKSLKKWSVVTGMAVAAVAVLLAGGIVGGVLSGVIPVGAQEPPVEGLPSGVWHGGKMGMGWGGQGAALDAAAEVLGMTPDDLRTELRAGKSLTQVAEEQGVDPQAVCDAIHAQVEERIQEAVADGRLTQEQANQILERMAEHKGDCLSAPGIPFGARHGRGMGIRWGGPGAALDAVAEVLDMTPEDLSTELEAGKSLAEVAEEQGVDPQAVCDAIHAQVEERIREAVADGRLTQEQANQILERVAEREGDCVEHGGMPFGLGFGGRGRSGGPGFHPHSARFGREGWDRSGAAGCPMGFAQEQ